MLNNHCLKGLDGIKVPCAPLINFDTLNFVQACFIYPSSILSLGDSNLGPPGRAEALLRLSFERASDAKQSPAIGHVSREQTRRDQIIGASPEEKRLQRAVSCVWPCGHMQSLVPHEHADEAYLEEIARTVV